MVRSRQAYTVLYIRLGTFESIIFYTASLVCKYPKALVDFPVFFACAISEKGFVVAYKLLRRVTAGVLLYSRVMLRTLFLNVPCFKIIKRIYYTYFYL